MTFDDILKHLKNGEKIKHLHWKTAFIYLDKDKIKIRDPMGKTYNYFIKHKDILSDDWVIKNGLAHDYDS